MAEKYLQLIRCEETPELMKHMKEFMLLTLIAYRAKRTNSFSAENLKIGEALIGDHKSCGLSQRQYRTAKQNLEKWGFSTFRATNKGTIAKLINSRIWDINPEDTDKQSDKQPTNKHEKSDKQPTTNKNERMNKNERTHKCAEWDSVFENEFIPAWGIDCIDEGDKEKARTVWQEKRSEIEPEKKQVIAAVRIECELRQNNTSRHLRKPYNWLANRKWSDPEYKDQEHVSSLRPETP